MFLPFYPIFPFLKCLDDMMFQWIRGKPTPEIDQPLSHSDSTYPVPLLGWCIIKLITLGEPPRAQKKKKKKRKCDLDNQLLLGRIFHG